LKLHIFTLALIALLCGLLPREVMAQSAAQQVLAAINAARAENGLAPLAENGLLTQAAQNHVNDMLTNYVYGHYGSDGSTVQMRVARTGYSATPWVSENWVSSGDAGGAMRWWMGDYIHRVNILTGRWTEIGIGVGTRGSEMIFVTVFSAGGGNSGEAAAIAAQEIPQQAPPPPSVKIEQLVVPPEGLDYTIQGGDTLLAIGLRYGLPWERIAEANGLNERSLLQIGQALHIPGSGIAAPPVPEVKTEDYTVQPNDTLFTIAAKRGMYWDEVAVVNGFSEQTVLQIGQVIQVPFVEEEPEPTRLIDMRRDGVGPVTVDESPTNPANYTMMQFDPNASAKMAGVISTGIGGPTGEGGGATDAVLAAHAAETPIEEVAVAETVASDVPTLYTVQPGDTIISIAVKHNLEWGPLLALNGLAEDTVLQLGQMIRLR
jgi:LysM repeat protein